jgi:hypothetical protein
MTKRKFQNEDNKENLNYKKTKNDEITTIFLKGISNKDEDFCSKINYAEKVIFDATYCFGANNSKIKKQCLYKLINSKVKIVTFQNNFFTDFSSRFLLPLLGEILSDTKCKIIEINIINNEIISSSLDTFSDNLKTKSLQKIHFQKINKCLPRAINDFAKICKKNNIKFINDDFEIKKDNSIETITNQENKEHDFNFFIQTYSSETYLLWQEKQGIKYDWGSKKEENNRPTTGGKSPSYTEKLKKKYGVYPYNKLIEEERKEKDNNIEL